MYVQRIRIVTDISMLRNSEIVCEAIPEDLALKRALFAELEDVIPEHVPIASGTSSFPPAELGAGMKRPERLIVAHFVHPVTIVSLAELVVPAPVDPIANEVVEAWLRRIAMQPIRLREPVTGFIVNRLQFAILREALSLVESGVRSCRRSTIVRPCRSLSRPIRRSYAMSTARRSPMRSARAGVRTRMRHHFTSRSTSN
jgi:3-hydroxybutyryl-CoA dehydrogenase